jgi:hypothetical protein
LQPTSCAYTLVPNMSGTINVPNTVPGSFVYATAQGTVNATSNGYTVIYLQMFVDGAPAIPPVAPAPGAGSPSSPFTVLAAYMGGSANVSTGLSWTVDGLWSSLGQGTHTIALYAANCGNTSFNVGAGATLTGMVLNR